MPFGTIAATGWASGLNLYGTALILGLSGRLGWAETPSWLQQTWVLAVLAALYAAEFVIDKIPWLDSGWDAVHTLIRPIGGALLGVGLAADAGSSEALAGVLAGGFALTAHGAKASARATANMSPEPVSNVVLSVAEDGVVAGLMALALAYPVVAGIVTVVLVVTSVGVIWLFAKAIQKLRNRWKARRLARGSGGSWP